MTLNSPLLLRNKICLLLLLISTQAQANTKDSIAKQLGLHLMVSLNPIIQLAEPIKNSGLFYSGAYYELQYGYKKHLAGIGYVRNYSAKNTYVNGVKKDQRPTAPSIKHFIHVQFPPTQKLAILCRCRVLLSAIRHHEYSVYVYRESNRTPTGNRNRRRTFIQRCIQVEPLF